MKAAKRPILATEQQNMSLTINILRNSILAGLMTVAAMGSSQTTVPNRGCGTGVPGEEWDKWFNAKVEAYKAEQAKQKRPPITITIPVVVHVLHGGVQLGVFPNVTSNQINSQLKILNDDFAGKGYNSGALAATGFSAVGAADTKITFCMAQFDPQGNALPEPGIDRVDYSSLGWQNPNSYGSPSSFQVFMDGTVKPATIWDPTQYFNIWISDVNPNAYLLGYASFPAGTGLSGLFSNFGSALTDGIWIWTRAFGNTGFVDPTYNKGRTAVHETGHWLGLRHIGGDSQAAGGDCNATDYCADTPAQKGGFATGTNGQNYGAPTYPIHVNVCSSPFGDMFMNFMDYCDDAVLYMFTPNQNDRMQTALAMCDFRKDLSASSATQCIGLPSVAFAEVQTGCVGTAQGLDFTSDALAGTNYTWSVEPSAGVVFAPSANVANPAITYPSVGNYTVTVVASNAIGVSSSSVEIMANICSGLSKYTAGGKQSVWPNPANSNLFINLGTDFVGGNVSITVFDVVGQEVLNLKVEDMKGKELAVDISSLHNGIYFATIDSGTQRSLQRFMVRH